MSPSTDGIGSATGLSATARVVEHYAPIASQIARQIASTETCRDEDEVRQKAKELGLVEQCISRAEGSCLHRSDIELRIIKQREVDLVAHRGNIGLVEQEFGGMSPALAVLGPLMRQRDNVVGSLANGAQNRPPLIGRAG